MIPIHNPGIGILTLLSLLARRNSVKACEAWFREYTGKKYILVTASCRSALYLAYKAADLEGEVITTPMTCHSAIWPVLHAQLPLVFCDIRRDDLLMDTSLAEALITEKTRYLQAVHHGGCMVDMLKLREVADRHSLILVEDCAQAFGASRDGITPGALGDIACYTLSKNAYGVGGGILATDNADIYHRASQIQQPWPPFSKKLLWFRLLRSLLETCNHCQPAALLHRLLMLARPARQESIDGQEDFTRHLVQPTRLFAKLFMIQQKHFKWLHGKQVMLANEFEKLLSARIPDYYPLALKGTTCSYAKFFFYHPRCDTLSWMEALNRKGIGVRHLENRYGSPRQPRADEIGPLQDARGLTACSVYFSVHDHLLQLPLHHGIRLEDIETIIQAINQLADETDSD